MKYQQALKYLVTVFTVAFLLCLTAGCGRDEQFSTQPEVKCYSAPLADQNTVYTYVRADGSTAYCYTKGY